MDCFFDFSDELDAFGFPYVYFLHYNQLIIVSPITNLRVRTMDFGQSIRRRLQDNYPQVHQAVKKKHGAKKYETGLFTLFTMITIPHHMEVYISSDSFDFSVFLRLVDHSEEDQQVKLKVADKQLELAEMWGPAEPPETEEDQLIQL